MFRFRQFLSRYKYVIQITLLFLVLVAIVIAKPNNASQVENHIRIWEEKSVCGNITTYWGSVEDGVLVSLVVPGERCKGFLPTLYCVGPQSDRKCDGLTDEETREAIKFFNDLKSSGASP